MDDGKRFSQHKILACLLSFTVTLPAVPAGSDDQVIGKSPMHYGAVDAQTAAAGLNAKPGETLSIRAITANSAAMHDAVLINSENPNSEKVKKFKELRSRAYPICPSRPPFVPAQFWSFNGPTSVPTQPWQPFLHAQSTPLDLEQPFEQATAVSEEMSGVVTKKEKKFEYFCPNPPNVSIPIGGAWKGSPRPEKLIHGHHPSIFLYAVNGSQCKVKDVVVKAGNDRDTFSNVQDESWSYDFMKVPEKPNHVRASARLDCSQAPQDIKDYLRRSGVNPNVPRRLTCNAFNANNSLVSPNTGLVVEFLPINPNLDPGNAAGSKSGACDYVPVKLF